MGRNLFGAVGALTALAATAVQSGRGAHAQTINENNVRGPRDVTVLLNGSIPPAPKQSPFTCTLTRTVYWNARAMAFAGTVPLWYPDGDLCELADVRDWEEQIALSVRQRLGDKGKH
jgi:hypothetical protein